MFEIKAPATSANLCSGFDTFGLTVTLYNTFKFNKSDQFICNGKVEDINNTNNLIFQSMLKGFEFLGFDPIPVELTIESDVPSTRGLGSSSTCVVAGIIAAYRLLGIRVNIEDVFNLASNIEGHPDNVSPCIYGGVSLSYREGNKFKTYRIDIDKKYKLCAFIPDFKLSTEKARNVLPDSYSRDDVVFNIQRASLLPLALERGDNEYVAAALHDRVHENYRKHLIPGYDDIGFLAKDYGFIGTYLSGAGPTIMGLYDKKIDLTSLKEELSRLDVKYDLIPLNIDFDGVQY